MKIIKNRFTAFTFGLIVAIAFSAGAATFNIFQPATGILVGNANSYVTTAASVTDFNGVLSGISTTPFRVISSAVPTSSVAEIRSTSAGSGSTSLLNASNFVDADFQIFLSQSGAATKFSRFGTTQPIPLQFTSRGQTQELLKTASTTANTGSTGGIGGSPANFTSCTGSGTGVLNCDVTAAQFTQPPACVCSANTSSKLCISNVNSSTSVNFNTITSNTAALVNDSVSIVCAGR